MDRECKNCKKVMVQVHYNFDEGEEFFWCSLCGAFLKAGLWTDRDDSQDEWMIPNQAVEVK